MKNNLNFQIEKTGYNYRTRKYRDILAVVIDANNEVIDAIGPGTGNHRTTLDWAEWRAESIRNDYPAAVNMVVYCGDVEIAVITFAETPSVDPETGALNFSAKVRETIENARTRSAWDRGVQAYALELLDKYVEHARYAANDGKAVPELSECTLLNGATDWSQYSWGGCSLIYNSDIAERLCSPSEMEKRNGGEWNPSRCETWLDVQARALRSAYLLIVRVVSDLK